MKVYTERPTGETIKNPPIFAMAKRVEKFRKFLPMPLQTGWQSSLNTLGRRNRMY